MTTTNQTEEQEEPTLFDKVLSVLLFPFAIVFVFLLMDRLISAFVRQPSMVERIEDAFWWMKELFLEAKDPVMGFVRNRLARVLIAIAIASVLSLIYI